MELIKGFKQTEVGVIPKDWEVKPLGKCLIGNPNYGINAAAIPYAESLPVYIRITDITEDGKFSKESITSVKNTSDSFFLQDGDLVFARTGASVGKTYLYNTGDGKLVFAGFLIRVKANPKLLLPEYLKYHTQRSYYWNWVRIMSMRSGQPGINGNQFKQLPVPVPSTLKEQSAIATVLSETDSLITKLEKIIAKKDAIKKGTMHALLTGKKRLPGFSEKWQKKRLNKIFKFLSTANNSRSELSDEGEIGYIHYGDIHTKWSEFLDASKESIPFINKDKVKDVPFLENGDLLIADASEDYEGLCACIELKNVNHRKIVGGLHTLLLRGNREEIADGFKGYLPQLKGFKEAAIRAATGISVYGISKKNLGEIEILIPDTNEQSAIAAVIADITTEIKQLEEKLQKYKMIKQGMMQNLLTGKIRLV